MSKSEYQEHIIVGADTETDHDDSHAWICQWAVVKMNPWNTASKKIKQNRSEYFEKHGYTLETLTAVFDSFLMDDDKKYLIYFHNLKYDMQFFREYLHDLQERYSIETEDGKPDCRLIIRDGKPIILQFHNIEFRDSANKMPAGTTVRQMGDMIGIPKLESPRGNFDAGWSETLTDDDFQYVIHDALIVATMMKKMHSLDRTHATSSGDAWASMKAIYNKHHNMNGYGQFKKHFPTLPHGVDAWLREGYSGGINLSNHRGYNEGTITHEDVNSMYPTVMMYDLLPYGKPKKVQVDELEDYDLWVIKAPMRFKLKPGMLPFFRFKRKVDAMLEGLNKTSDPVVSMDSFHILTLTNVDLANYSRFYDITIGKEAEYVAFNSEIGANKEYIEHWYKVKSEAPKNSVERLAAKLMLNSAYGRYGMSDREQESSFEFDEELGDYNLKQTETVSEEVPGYLPYAMFVTSQARRRLLDNVYAIGCENVIHCDTDSVIHYGPPSSLGHTDALGDWGIESCPKAIYEGGVKRYIEILDEVETIKDVSMACAGVPQRSKDGYPYGMWIELLDDPTRIYADGTELGDPHYHVKTSWLRKQFINAGSNPDDVNTMRLIPKKVRGGVILTETTFKLHDMMRIRFRGAIMPRKRRNDHATIEGPYQSRVVKVGNQYRYAGLELPERAAAATRRAEQGLRIELARSGSFRSINRSSLSKNQRAQADRFTYALQRYAEEWGTKAQVEKIRKMNSARIWFLVQHGVINPEEVFVYSEDEDGFYESQMGQDHLQNMIDLYDRLMAGESYAG